MALKVELGGRVVRVLDSGQLHQSERSWVRFLDGPLKIARPQNSHVVTWPAGDQEKHDWLSLLLRAHLWSSVAEWLECWTQVNSTRARGPGFDSWTDPSKIARPQDSRVVTCPAGGPGKARSTRPSTPSSSMELGGRVVRVLDSGQLHQSERSWVRFLDGPLKNCQASGQSRGHVSSGWTRKNTID